MLTLTLYRFRYYDQLRKRWMLAVIANRCQRGDNESNHLNRKSLSRGF
jgi:hypothetical protein